MYPRQTIPLEWANVLYRDIKHWLLAFESAFAALQLRRSEAGEEERAAAWAEPCSRHGSSCVWIMAGKQVEHIPWAESDPIKCAEVILAGLSLRRVRVSPPPNGN